MGEQTCTVCTSMPFNYTLTQRPPHLHDHHPAHPSCQKHSCCSADRWNRWIMQGRRHHARRVLRPLRYHLTIVYWDLGRQQQRCEFLLVHPHSKSGLCFPTTPIFRQAEGLGRSSLHCSSFYESPTGARWRAIPLLLGVTVSSRPGLDKN